MPLITKKITTKAPMRYYPGNNTLELAKIIVKLLQNGETNLNCIDVSGITDMSALFYNINKQVRVRDIDISEWDVSNVTNMNSMFANCAEFNSDLSYWDVSNVWNMASMFDGCRRFNSDIRNWNTQRLSNLTYMFSSCSSFDYDLSCWNLETRLRKGNIWGAFEGCTVLMLHDKLPSWRNMDL